jgi:hypothetical protein
MAELNVKYSTTLYPNSLKSGLESALKELNLSGEVSSQGSDALVIQKTSSAGNL